HHYHTMSRASDAVHRRAFSRPNPVTDAVHGLTYAAAMGANGPEMVARQGKGVERAGAKWAFGSGNRAFTYVGDFDGAAVELRLSYFRQAGRWDFTPGQQPKYTVSTPVGTELSLPDAIACVNCHTTAAVVKDNVIRPEQSILGIGCEGCHGAGKRHIQAVQAGEKDLRMVRLSEQRPRTTLELCGSCHRTEATGGDPHSPTTQGQLPRLQGPALALSRCYKESQGRLTCVTCHNPHRNASDTPRAGYNRICASCHPGPQKAQAACPRAPAGDCVSCHMPAQAVEMPTRPVFHTHWIKVW
ncbi:MAG TPA: cytochrome c3 family protein, partial [Armatimonadota bacterium]|nr:cytochrome c3 family protein [Armatimonadota bacterium]